MTNRYHMTPDHGPGVLAGAAVVAFAVAVVIVTRGAGELAGLV